MSALSHFAHMPAVHEMLYAAFSYPKTVCLSHPAPWKIIDFKNKRKTVICSMIFVFLSCRPQPYRALKESDSADGEEAVSPEKAKEPLPPSPLLSSNATEINLLEDIFPNLEVETQPQTLSQAKSLEDLRTPKEEADQRCTFDYQVWTEFCMPRGNLQRTRVLSICPRVLTFISELRNY